jgi:hypothetical protein
MSAYAPKRRQYGKWYASTIHREAPREVVAEWLRTIRRQDGTAEAIRFRDWLLWLGTYPVIFHKR